MIGLIPVGARADVTLYGNGHVQAVDNKALGKLLYPESREPEKLIRKIYERNKASFTERDTILLKVDTPYPWSAPSPPDIERQIDAVCRAGKKFVRKRGIRLFSIPWGLMKVCKLSRSPLAFDVLERLFDLQSAYLTGSLPKPDPTLDYLSQLPKGSRERSEGIRRIAQEEQKSRTAIYRRLDRFRKGEPLDKSKSGMRRYVAKKYRGMYEEAFRLKREGLSIKDIARRLSIPYTTVCTWLADPPKQAAPSAHI
jgi:transposase